MDNLKGWAIDLKAVYRNRWNDKAKFHLSEDLWESPDKTFASLLYGIMEVGVSKEVGRLAVFRNKEKPEMILNLPKLECWYLYDSTVQFGKDGLVFVHRFKAGRKVLGLDLCVLDPAGDRIAVLDQLAGNFYQVLYLDGTKYRLRRMVEQSSTETIIDLNDLSWRHLAKGLIPTTVRVLKEIRFLVKKILSKLG